MGLKSGILNNIIASFPRLKEPVKQLLGDILSNKAAQGEKEKLWTDPLKYPDIADLQMVCQISTRFQITDSSFASRQSGQLK